MKSGVVCHGDCDGVISAFIYIKHYMVDSYPSRLGIVFTQPWRAQIDARRLGNQLAEAVFLDLAISSDLANYILTLGESVSRIAVIDHHMSSREYIDKLRSRGVRVIWGKAPSTPRLIKETLKPYMNPYEEFLVEVADICEGSEGRDQEAVRVADMIKLSIARDPGDVEYMNYLVDLMLKSRDISADVGVLKRAKIAKFLLRRLLKIMSERALEVSSVKVVALDLPESRIFAGLLGIAATEFAKMGRRDAVLVRREEGKVVVTVRSISDRAYRVCKELASRLGGKFGGHAEAASATLPDIELSEAVRAIVEVVKGVARGKD